MSSKFHINLVPRAFCHIGTETKGPGDEVGFTSDLPPVDTRTHKSNTLATAFAV